MRLEGCCFGRNGIEKSPVVGEVEAGLFYTKLVLAVGEALPGFKELLGRDREKRI